MLDYDAMQEQTTTCLDCGCHLTESEIDWEIEYCPDCADYPPKVLAEPLNGAPPVHLLNPHTVVTILLIGGSLVALLWGAVKHVKDGWQ
jgi:hypothetical protein